MVIYHNLLYSYFNYTETERGTILSCVDDYLMFANSLSLFVITEPHIIDFQVKV